MKSTVSTARGGVRGAVTLAMCLALGLSGVGAARAQQSAAEARTVQGVWYVQVVIRDCASGAA